jgi:hypothetical protein
MSNTVSKGDLEMTKRTKRYADGRQKLLGTHLGARRFFPRPSLKAVRRKIGKGGPLNKSHKQRRLFKMMNRLNREK